MTLRRKLVLGAAAIHLLFAAVAARVLVEEPGWLIALELLLVVSALLTARAVATLLEPLELLDTAAELLAEGDFATRLTPAGHPEIDRLTGVYNAMVDRLREERLRVREQNELLDRIVEASPGGVVIADHDGRVVEANPAAERLLGVAAAEARGRAPGDLPSPLAPALGELAPGESCVVARPDGRRLGLRRAAFRDRGFERSFYLVEELTEELRRSERAAYEKLIRTLSHEVNNSVGAVGSLLASLRAGRPGGGGVADAAGGERRADHPGADGAAREAAMDRALEIAAGRLESLRSFVARLAEVVRLPEPERRPCDVEALVDEVLELAAPELERRGVELERRRQGPIGTVEADRNQLEQALLNVVKNALEAMEGGGRLVVATRAAGVPGPPVAPRRVAPQRAGSPLCPVIEITDSGGGVADDVRRELFTPFFTTKPEGCGLGLTLVKEILDRHGFAFALENVGGEDGGPRGARFRLELPGPEVG